MSGLRTMKTRESAIGTSDHQPIQSRLHTETASSGSTVNLVQTLAGFAWRIQFSPSSPNVLAILASRVVVCVLILEPPVVVGEPSTAPCREALPRPCRDRAAAAVPLP